MRIKIEFPEDYIFNTTIPVMITDLNYGNHLGNVAIVGMLHEARVRCLKSMGLNDELDLFGDGSIGLIMGDLAVQFKKEAFYGDSIVVAVAIENVSRVSFDMLYRLSSADSGEAVAVAKTGLVLFDYKTRRPVDIPQKLLDLW